MPSEVAALEASELRSSVRFPLRLPVEVHGEEGVNAETQNISAGGVLLTVSSNFPVGSKLEFTIAMPAHVLGTPTDVMVKCVGRVVRCDKQGDHSSVAAVIDEYRFDRA